MKRDPHGILCSGGRFGSPSPPCGIKAVNGTLLRTCQGRQPVPMGLEREEKNLQETAEVGCPRGTHGGQLPHQPFTLNGMSSSIVASVAWANTSSSITTKHIQMIRGRRTFLLVNLVVVVLNATLGFLVNMAFFTSRATHRDRYVALPSNQTVAPTNLEVTDEVLSPAFGLVDRSGNYTTHGFVWAATEWASLTAESRACLTTHSSVDRLFWVAWQADTWAGPISVSIFAPGSDYAVAAGMVSYLRRCFSSVEERVSFHIVYPRGRPPRPSPRYQVFQLNCAEPEEANKVLLELRDEGEEKERRYPQNLMRNMARMACPCDNVLAIDIDMIPPQYMAENFTSFLAGEEAGCWKCAYVVPVYEIHDSVTFLPPDKMELLHLLLKGKARRYHMKVYAKNQGNSKLEKWEMGEYDPSSTYRVLYNITTYEEFWEPVLLLPFTAPLFDERFLGYGFTRSSHVYELYRRGWKFKVLDRAFLTHRGFQTTTNYPPSRYAQIEINKVRYQIFKRELHAQLGLKPPQPLKGPSLRQKLPSLLSKRQPPSKDKLTIRTLPGKKRMITDVKNVLQKALAFVKKLRWSP